MLINLLEAPALAFLMSFFLKFHEVGVEVSGAYVFRENDNLPQYLLIVALFLGLTVSAEEIIRDRKILQREKFLDLSWMSYLMSKVGLLFLISAIQTLLFVLVGDHVLGIEGMTFPHWLLLFSTSCFANVLGLNVSASFNSAKVIYILIPVLIIPQLLFSGIIVKFDKLHPWFASQKSVPWIGNVMASRWAYEGLAVTQFMENPYERHFFAFDQRMKTANWKKDLWVRELQNRSSDIRRALLNGEDVLDADLALLRSELEAERDRLKGFSVTGLDKLEPGLVTPAVLDEADAALETLIRHYRAMYKEAEQAKEARIAALTATPELRKSYFELMDRYRNDGLADVVTNKNEVHVIVQDDGELVRKSDPIYQEPDRSGLFSAQFYAPGKWFFGVRLSTLWANAMVLWTMALVLAVTLYMEVFPRAMRLFPQRDAS